MPNDPAARLSDLEDTQGELLDEITGEFDDQVSTLTAGAIALIAAWLARELATDRNGRVTRTIGNIRLLSKLDERLLAALTRAGYPAAVKRLTARYAEQLPLLDTALHVMEGGKKDRAEVTEADARAVVAQQKITRESLLDAPHVIARQTKQKVLNAAAGQTIDEVTKLLAAQFDRLGTHTATIAATGASTYYRVASDRVYRRIERERGPLYYVYAGPRDKLNRPFCRKLLNQVADGRIWTREEINGMENGQLPDVMVTNGGFNCRHQWRLALAQEITRWQEKQAA